MNVTTKDVADKLVGLCRSGKFEDAVSSLYGDQITSREMPGMPNELVNGKTAVEQKSVQWMTGVDQIHGCEVSEPIVSGDFFTVQMKIDVTFTGSPRQMLDELCVYQVADGKIVAEQFFYSM
jgi:hypothetical protein